MKVAVTEDCIACGLCVDTCPEVFEMGDQYAQLTVDAVPEEHQEAVRQAAEECPVEAIIIEEE
jgi:ferredoxin